MPALQPSLPSTGVRSWVPHRRALGGVVGSMTRRKVMVQVKVNKMRLQGGKSDLCACAFPFCEVHGGGVTAPIPQAVQDPL